MASDDSDVDPELRTLTPADAFATLGDETRLAILEALGVADGPVAFATLQERVGYDTSGNFSYHLEKLEGHFIRQTPEGYQLTQAGRRIVQAVLAGTVTEAPRLERTRIDRSCPFCDAPVELQYDEGGLEGYCSDCDGIYTPTDPGGSSDSDGDNEGYLGYLPLPPAGIQGRSMAEAEHAAWTWGFRHVIAIANDVCPSCSAQLTQEPVVCPDHDTGDGRCGACGNRHAVQVHSTCSNCIFDGTSAFALKLYGNTDLLAFVTTHGLDPVNDQWAFGWTYDEVVHSVDPFDASFTFTVDGDSLTLEVDADLTVVDTRWH